MRADFETLNAFRDQDGTQVFLLFTKTYNNSFGTSDNPGIEEQTYKGRRAQ